MAEKMEEMKQDLGADIGNLTSVVRRMEQSMLKEFQELRDAMAADRVNAVQDLGGVRQDIAAVRTTVNDHLQNHQQDTGSTRWQVTTIVSVIALVVATVFAWVR